VQKGERDIAVRAALAHDVAAEIIFDRPLALLLCHPGRHQADNGYEIVEYADFPSESDSLLTAQVDAAAQDLPVFNQFVKDNEGKVKVAAQFNTGEQYGIGMKLGNTALKNVVDGAITEAKADGTYDAIYAKWIGGTPPAASGSSTAPSSN